MGCLCISSRARDAAGRWSGRFQVQGAWGQISPDSLNFEPGILNSAIDGARRMFFNARPANHRIITSQATLAVTVRRVPRYAAGYRRHRTAEHRAAGDHRRIQCRFDLSELDSPGLRADYGLSLFTLREIVGSRRNRKSIQRRISSLCSQCFGCGMVSERRAIDLVSCAPGRRQRTDHGQQFSRW
jgi:hypothetical protein